MMSLAAILNPAPPGLLPTLAAVSRVDSDSPRTSCSSPYSDRFPSGLTSTPAFPFQLLPRSSSSSASASASACTSASASPSGAFAPRLRMPPPPAILAKEPGRFARALRPRGTIRYRPHELLDDVSLCEMRRFRVSPFGAIQQSCAHIPYNSGKKDFFAKTGRESFEVFKYSFFLPGDEKEHTVMWDYNVGLVRMTPFFRCCGYGKTVPAKMLGLNPGLKDITHSITGGSISAQGYWMPFNCARAVCATFCFNISGALIPIFGPSFPDECCPPSSTEFGQMMIDPRIVVSAMREADLSRRTQTPHFPPPVGGNDGRLPKPTVSIGNIITGGCCPSHPGQHSFGSNRRPLPHGRPEADVCPLPLPRPFRQECLSYNTSPYSIGTGPGTTTSTDSDSGTLACHRLYPGSPSTSASPGSELESTNPLPAQPDEPVRVRESVANPLLSAVPRQSPPLPRRLATKRPASDEIVPQPDLRAAMLLMKLSVRDQLGGLPAGLISAKRTESGVWHEETGHRAKRRRATSL